MGAVSTWRVGDVSCVVVISPHPDDEAIGCGGAIREHVVSGDQVRTIFLTSGERGGHGRSPEETAKLREAEAEAAAGILGTAGIEFWRQPDGGVRMTALLVRKLTALLREWSPAWLYVTHSREMHPDHRAAARLVKKAIRGLEGSAPRVRMYEVWTPIERMDAILDISAHVDALLAAIQAHRCQCELMRLDEAALCLNRYRGEMHSWPGGDYAEVFQELSR